MSLLDIATAQPYLFSFRSKKSLCHSHYATFVVGNESSTTRLIHFSIFDKPMKWGLVESWLRCGGFVVKAVESSSTATEESEDIDVKELKRREKISKANAGKRPWNEGLKHSPETRQLISERTRLAMKNPKIRMKLQGSKSPRSEETRIKIGHQVRIYWQKRNKKHMLQETCRFEWESLVAEASRKGFCGEEELQWNSYKILDEQLTQEWLDIDQQRKASHAARGNKRAPKSLEQRRRMSAATAAKWADPADLGRVFNECLEDESDEVCASKMLVWESKSIESSTALEELESVKERNAHSGDKREDLEERNDHLGNKVEDLLEQNAHLEDKVKDLEETLKSVVAYLKKQGHSFPRKKS